MRSLAVFLALLIASCAALAQPYVFGAISPQAQVKTNAGDGVSDSTTAWYFGAGYRFSKRFAAEASYFYVNQIFGTAATRVEGSSRLTTTHFWEAEGPGLAALGTLPVADGVALLVKGGAYYLKHTHASQTAENEATSPFRFLGAQVHPVATERRWALDLGLGAEFTVDNLALRALVEQLSGQGELERIRLVSIQLLYSF